MNYIVALVSPSHHLMFETDNYIKVYPVKAVNEEELNTKIEYLERKFCLEFEVALKDVSHLWTFKVKDKPTVEFNYF